ncbi:MAG: phosphoribosyltransferase [Gammaproteobacteria bacterium]|nr:MAG: phosphoribosyltransferase [Gammaproteobacteria bacterium]
MVPNINNLHEINELHNRSRVFQGRKNAGKVLASMLGKYRNSDAIILGIPAGGMPVAAELAAALNLDLDVAVAKKITPPFNTEFGYGAVAFDGSILLNEPISSGLGLSEDDIARGTRIAKDKVDKRIRKFRGDTPFPDIKNRTVILIDDGLATGVTFKVTIKALRNQGAKKIVGAIPTGHYQSLTDIAAELDELYCANIRTGYSYAVAEAYKDWYDVPDNEVIGILKHTAENHTGTINEISGY